MIENVLKGICHVDFAKGFYAKVITWLLNLKTKYSCRVMEDIKHISLIRQH